MVTEISNIRNVDNILSKYSNISTDIIGCILYRIPQNLIRYLWNVSECLIFKTLVLIIKLPSKKKRI